MATRYYLLSPIILSSSASPSRKLLVVLQFLPLNSSSPKNFRERGMFRVVLFIHHQTLFNITAMLFILKGKEQLPRSALVSSSAVSYSSCCLKHLLTGGKAHCEEKHCCLGWLRPKTGLTPLFAPGTERVRSSQPSLSTAVGYILVDENHFHSISVLRTEGQCPGCSWTRPVCSGTSVKWLGLTLEKSARY